MRIYDIVKHYKNIRLEKCDKLMIISYFRVQDCYINLCKKDTEKTYL